VINPVQRRARFVGLGIDVISLLQRLKRTGEIQRPGSIVEIGAQQLSNSFLRARAELDALGRVFGARGVLDLAPPVEARLAHGSLEHLAASAPPARDFWRWLGYDYATIDIDGSPGSIPLDLNFDPVPERIRGRFELVTNYGTTEHVANQLNAFAVIHDLAAPKGLMIHALPAQGMVNHGLINYNPKFFWMLARSNGYRSVYMDFRSDRVPYPLPDNVLDFVESFEPGVAGREATYTTADCMLVAVLQKVYDMPFVPPIDVPTGTRTDNPALRERYWTVFKPDAFRNPLAFPARRGKRSGA
jgi:hypothetical protein